MNRFARLSMSFLAVALFAVPVLGQGSLAVPEFFGVYARDRGTLTAVGGGRSASAASLQQVSVVLLGQAQATRRMAVKVGSDVHFILFDIAPAEAARSLSLYRLPLVRNNITVSDIPDFRTGRQSASARPVNLPGLMRLSASQIRLLQKPVASQPQMIELVPDSTLSAGLYGLLYAPATGMLGGAGAGQNVGWTSVLLVGDTSAAATGEPCVDLVLTGGLGGVLGMDSPDRGSIASFPLLDPRRAPVCSVANPSAPSQSDRSEGVGVPGSGGRSSAVGKYLRRDKNPGGFAGDYLELRADAHFVLVEGGRGTTEGTYTIQGDTLVLKTQRGEIRASLIGNTVRVGNAIVLEKE